MGASQLSNRVLIIEDEADVASLMEAVLEDEGYTVRVHSTGDCFHVVQSFRPDVILCDYQLPVYDGETVLRRLREAGKLDARFIVISAMKRACERWREWGADDFIAKPFDLDRLLATVSRSVSKDGAYWTSDEASGRSEAAS